MNIDQRALRDALGGFATGITVVTVRDRNGGHIGVTMNSFTSLSLDPPLVLFSLDRGSDTLGDFAAATAFAVNILSSGQSALSQKFAVVGDHRFDGVAFREGENGCALIEDALGFFECVVENRLDGGDHVIYLGRVTRLGTAPDKRPLVFFRGGYRELGQAPS